MRRLMMTVVTLLFAGSGQAAAGELQDLLDKGFRVVGVTPGQLQDPIVFLVRDNQLFACQSYAILRPTPGQKQCTPIK